MSTQSITTPVPSIPPDELLDTKQAAEYLLLKPETLEQMRWQGVGPTFVKVGRLIRYRRNADLVAYVSNRVFASTTAAQASLRGNP